MQLTEQCIGNARVLKLAGRVDHAAAETFKAALNPHLEHCREGVDVVVLDFSGVESISSAGFRVLFQAKRQAQEQKGAIAIAGLQPAVQEIFTITKFAKVMPCYADVRAALAELSPSALAALGTN